jgi:hypothetical protein
VQWQNVRVLQVRRGLDLGQEPLGADHRGQLGTEHLDGDLAIVLQVLGEIDGRHAALTELPLDAVAVGERVGECGWDHLKIGNCKFAILKLQ